ncbi:MAG: hypothetical protein GF353_15260 [Candidatus Lokiarchaeota archaeon]|nr:hypothetical protein [Candidatus Lokiarchaeota archaeon]
MDFFIKNLKETLEAINKLIDNNIYIVNTKRIRRCYNIKSSNRSKINFIWRSLNYLEDYGILEVNGSVKPKNYKIKSDDRVDVEGIVDKVKEERNTQR